MLFISIKKKTIGLFFLAIILCLVAVTIYSAAKVSHNENKYQSVLAMTQMFDDTHFIAYISDVEAHKNKQNIEVFDITKGEVIITEPTCMDIQNEVFNYVKTIKSLYTKVMPFPEKGYVIRVPFDTPIKVNQKLINEAGIKAVDSLFIILSDKEAPIMLILDGQERPYFYTFNANIQALLDYVKLKPLADQSQESMEDTDQENTDIPTEIETEEEPSDTTTEKVEETD
ncbi:MAG: hypothetical protein GX796_00145 [Clostridiaceae bacterium]|jgi:hypothetical protein|nr:hypothetical protein [Clostridiaceae bacterium]